MVGGSFKLSRGFDFPTENPGNEVVVLVGIYIMVSGIRKRSLNAKLIPEDFQK